MTDSTTEAKKSQAFPDHWSLFLHCTICFGFFHNPHTLECGHTFCRRCLKRLAEIAKTDTPDVRLRRLSLNCPTCRHPFPAKPAFTGRLRTCILLKHLVELWKRECKMLLSSQPQHFRSICSQTKPEAGKAENQEHEPLAQPLDLHEEFSVRTLAGEEYLEAVMRRVSESTEEIEQDHPDDFLRKVNLHAERRDQNFSDSESSVSSSGDDGSSGTRGVGGTGVGANTGDDGGTAGARRDSSSVSNVSLPDLFGTLGAARVVLTTSESFPARLLLIGVWFIYSLLIVALAETFLPYVILFTLFFFLIILR